MKDRWIYACYVIVALLIVCNYALLRLRGISIITDQNVVIPQILDKRRNYDTLCCNALLCSLDGIWRLHSDVSYEDLHRVRNSNMELRLRKGWPAQLFHGDMRCGSSYPLTRVIRQRDNAIFIPDVASQCDGFGNAPCCKNDIGWCGRGDYFCKCESCINYGTIIYTELYDWTHSLNCKRKKLVKRDACEFLGDTFSSITFLGDSLVRHVFSSLLIQLNGDDKAGALKSDVTEADKTFCGYENQFVDSSCHAKLALDWTEVKSHKSYCNTSKIIPRLEFVQAYSSRHNQMAFEKVAKAFDEPRPLILMGIGIHDNYDDKKIIEQYLAPIVELRNRKAEYTDPVLVWLNPHAAGPLKPIRYQITQGNANILRFNAALREYCQRNSIYIFDTYNITKGVHSFDGTHYGGALNHLKVEILLHSLSTLPIQ